MMSMKVAHGASYTLRYGSEVIDADMLCIKKSNDDGEYESDCTLYWEVVDMGPLEIVSYNLSESFSYGQPLVGQEVKFGQTVDLSDEESNS